MIWGEVCHAIALHERTEEQLWSLPWPICVSLGPAGMPAARLACRAEAASRQAKKISRCKCFRAACSQDDALNRIEDPLFLEQHATAQFKSTCLPWHISLGMQ